MKIPLKSKVDFNQDFIFVFNNIHDIVLNKLLDL